eukprot:Awhi_evm2s11964
MSEFAIDFSNEGHFELENLQTLLRTLLKEKYKVTSLNLRNLGLNSEEMKILVETLPLSSSLRHVDLSFNSIGIDGLVALTRVFMNNKTLKSLNLESTETTCEGAYHLSQLLLEGQTLLCSLNLDGNYIGNLGLYDLSDALKKNKSLKSLSLKNNMFGDEITYSIPEMLLVNTTLTTIHLNTNWLCKEATNSFSQSLSMNNTLTTLDIDNNRGDQNVQWIEKQIERNRKLLVKTYLQNIFTLKDMVYLQNCDKSIIFDYLKNQPNSDMVLTNYLGFSEKSVNKVIFKSVQTTTNELVKIIYTTMIQKNRPNNYHVPNIIIEKIARYLSLSVDLSKYFEMIHIGYCRKTNKTVFVAKRVSIIDQNSSGNSSKLPFNSCSII